MRIESAESGTVVRGPAAAPQHQGTDREARHPLATYRVQFNAQFTLRQARELVPYLEGLGISHLYASPLLKAQPHSMHGYDVCDFGQLNPELGTEEDFQALVDALHERGMGLVLDVVPNHMGVAGPDNRWWWDVLTRGQASRFAGFFDIDWASADPRLHGRVLLPVLAERYGRALQKGRLRLQAREGTLVVRCYDQFLPLDPESLPTPAPPLEQLSAPAALDRLLERQHYRLTWWRHADCTLNYRRFFNIASLAALRVEDERVFAEVHRLLLRWLKAGRIDGLRIDHIDGLRDPAQYLQRLRQRAPECWLTVEKILQPGEALPAHWPVAGTTGYDFLNRVSGLFVDGAGAQPLADFYAEFADQPSDYAALVREKKRVVLRQLFAPEVKRLAVLLVQISARHWQYRDITHAEFRQVIVEVASAFSVYRTYVQPETGILSEQDAGRITEAIALARHGSHLDPGLFEFLAGLLVLELRGQAETDFVLRFQQLTGPAMAKGAEDTACYCFNRLISLNEVGGDPGRFGLAVAEFHAAAIRAQAQWPDSMVTTSTHDTKHGEDFRARLGLLSELPEAWRAAVLRWSARNERYRTRDLPGRNIEYHFYQTLVGAWPLTLERALVYMDKVACEAKMRTTWTSRDPRYDKALARFVTGALGDSAFTADLAEFVAGLLEPGWITSLAQSLIRLTAPGVPDCYQGAELWDLSLVDPDNRRPVDFNLRRRLLEAAAQATAATVWQRVAEGLPKLWLIRQTLTLRRRHPDWFDGRSSYRPLAARGAKAHHVIAFQRGGAVAVAPRLVFSLLNPGAISPRHAFAAADKPDRSAGVPGTLPRADWGDTRLDLPPGVWHNHLTGEPVPELEVRMTDLFTPFPVALLSQGEMENV